MAKGPSITSLLESGVNAATLRGKTIANNLANVNTPGFRRSAVEFETLLDDALRSGKAIKPKSIEPEIFEPQNTILNSMGNDVDMEVEVGQMVKNSAKSKAYMRILNKMYRQISSAIGIAE
ncbi:MAG: flagellar basal body rod protein FlgB [Planctomycetes bacterium]|nr:flagellar basal body rod protein FlgB [Planctomycetota bacterium]